MDKEQTKEFPDARSFEDRMLSGLTSIRTDMAMRFTSLEQRLSNVGQRIESVEQRLITLEDIVDARLRETRPIWEAVQSQLGRLDEKFDNVIRDLYEVRTDIRLHDKRLKETERRLNS